MNTRDDKDVNADPISGEPGAHPVGTGVGAVSGGATGAAIGAAAGPVGAVVGAAIGAVAGGLAGKGVAEMIDPTAENAHWRDNYQSESYVKSGVGYDQYESAYRTGYTGFGKHAGKKWDDVENDLQHDYEQTKGNSSLAWSDAKHATKAAWHKVERARFLATAGKRKQEQIHQARGLQSSRAFLLNDCVKAPSTCYA